MRVSSVLSLLSVGALFALAGCSGTSGGGPGDPAAGPPANPLGGPAGPAPGGAPVEGGGPQGPVPLAAWVGGGKTVPVTAQLKGLTLNSAGETGRVRLDFMLKSETGRYKIKAQAEVTGPLATVQLPETSDSPVWLFAWTDAGGNGPDNTDLVCLLAEPITLDGKPVDITLDFVTGVEPPDVSEGGQAVEGAPGLELPPPGAGAGPAGAEGAPAGPAGADRAPAGAVQVGGVPAPGPDGGPPSITGPLVGSEPTGAAAPPSPR